jgi:hypothetical protein
MLPLQLNLTIAKKNTLIFCHEDASVNKKNRRRFYKFMSQFMYTPTGISEMKTYVQQSTHIYSKADGTVLLSTDAAPSPWRFLNVLVSDFY